MRREQVIKMLDEHKATLCERFGVTDLALFGSMARNMADEDSDVDILVSFDGPANSKRYFGVQFYLEKFTGVSGRSGDRHYARNCARMWKRMLSMSDSRGSQREWRFSLQDMIGFAEKCLSYTHTPDE